MKPEVSVIIPCFNEERYIEQLIQGLLEQDLSRDAHELIFVDGKSSDRTPELIEEYAKVYEHVRLLENPDRSVPHAMNKGIREANGRILVRLDAHASYPNNYLSYLVEKLKETGADNVGAPGITMTLSGTPKARAIQKVLSHPFGVGNSYFRIGIAEAKKVDTVPFGCFWKERLEGIGGFNTALERNQDIELNKRILRNGGKILLLPGISWVYYARETYSALARNNFQNGLWNIRTIYITRDLSSLSPRHLVPLAFVGALILSLLFGVFIPPFLLLPSLILAIYLLAIFIVSQRARDVHTSLFHMIWTFFVLHFSYGIGSFLGLFRLDDLFRKAS